MNLSKLTKTFKNFYPALRLYLFYLCASFPIWLANKFFLGTTVSEPIAIFSEQFGPTVTADISSVSFFFQSLAVIFVIYLLIIIPQMLLKMNIGGVAYILLAVLVALASGISFGGGLITYTWGPNIFTSLLGQVEWIGGALIVSSSKFQQKNDYRIFGIGSVLVVLSVAAVSFVVR